MKEMLLSGEDAGITGDKRSIFPAGSQGKEGKIQIKRLFCFWKRLPPSVRRGIILLACSAISRQGLLEDRLRMLCACGAAAGARVGAYFGRAMLSLGCFPHPAGGWAEHRGAELAGKKKQNKTVFSDLSLH